MIQRAGPTYGRIHPACAGKTSSGQRLPGPVEDALADASPPGALKRLRATAPLATRHYLHTSWNNGYYHIGQCDDQERPLRQILRLNVNGQEHEVLAPGHHTL